MEKHPSSIRNRNDDNEPSLGRAAALFGIALAGAFAVGIWFTADEEPETRAASTTRIERSQGSVKARPVTAKRTTSRAQETPLVVAATKEGNVMESGSATTAMSESPAAESSQPTPAPISAATTTWADAEAAYFEGDYEEATRRFEAWASAHPGSVWGPYMLGLSRRHAGDLDGSEKALRAALELEENHEKSLVNLSRTLLDAGNAAVAVEFIERAVEVNPTSVDAQRVSGRVYHSLGQVENALAAYDRALALDENDAWSLNNRGLILIEEGRFDEAAPLLIQACAVRPEMATFQNNLGIALERTGDARGAADAFQAAIAAAPGHSKASASLARVQAHIAPETETPTVVVLGEVEESGEAGAGN